MSNPVGLGINLSLIKKNIQQAAILAVLPDFGRGVAAFEVRLTEQFLNIGASKADQPLQSWNSRARQTVSQGALRRQHGDRGHHHRDVVAGP